ncbi:threonine/homoserine/homoserine lactone efflux protein [Nocardiopsis mwathae]|uniref:Threonine/homoserine/homoserine lactone efflux protein n=1 Tax=Nocardiopsis mwathae TaxID=1472723 RepID=A0A7X0D4Y7_9ACTN|nr:LysE family translocator [Nocardiopsis mwathae]MBB6171812.1 threonine/homoserine/homoserine lactone efflux protein [Nocardiopsis mwathae]
MPEPHTLGLFLLAAGALVLIYILTQSVSQGRAAGVVSALGVETGTLVHVTSAAIGLSSLLATSALAFDIVEYLGAAYLVYLGVRTILTRPAETPGHTDPGTPAPRPTARIFRDGLLVNVLNPTVALFFLALLPQFVDPAQGPAATQILVFGAIMAAMGLTVDLAMALGGVYLAMGAATALTGRR